MKRWIAGLSATFVMALSGLMPDHSYADRASANFYCGKDAGGDLVTIADNGYRKIALIRWNNVFSSAAYSLERRCAEVAKRFQLNSETNNLNYLVPARVNGVPVICASSTPVSSIIECPFSRVLIVLPPMDNNPNQFIKKLLEINTETSPRPINHLSAIIQIGQTYNLDSNLWILASASFIPPIQNIPSTRKNPWGKSSENLPPSNRSSEEKIPLAEKDKQVTFACVVTDKTVATVARTSKGDIPIITWTSIIFNSKWTPKNRCEQVTKKFENLRQKNALNYITTSVVNGSPVICAVKTVNESCTEDEEILITLKDYSEAQKVLDQMFLSNSYIPVDADGVGKRDGRDSVCLSRGANGNCSGILISAIEL